MKTSDTSMNPPKNHRFWQEVFRARTYQSRAKELASMVKNQVSGLSSPGAYAFYSQDSSLPKMFQLCLDGEWDVFSQTFTRAGMMLGGTVSQLPPLVPLTKGTGYLSSRGPNTEGMWPTPCADGDRATMFKQGGMPLGVAVRMMEPGPVTQQMVLNPDWAEWLMGFEAEHTQIDSGA